jgi:acyl carrier protein
MTREDIVHKIVEILKDFFDVPTLEADETTCFKDIKEWDSLAFVTLMASLEAEYGVSLDITNLQHIEYIGDIVSMIESA